MWSPARETTRTTNSAVADCGLWTFYCDCGDFTIAIACAIIVSYNIIKECSAKDPNPLNAIRIHRCDDAEDDIVAVTLVHVKRLPRLGIVAAI